MDLLSTDWANFIAWIFTVIGGLAALWFFWDQFWFLWNKLFKKEEQKASEPDSLTVDLNRIPEPTAALVGRTAELTQIKTALASTETKIVAIVAGGGVGKSALTWEWLQQMQPDYGGAELVFGWSFYSQGSHQTANSSAPFFQEALPFFGFEDKLPSDEIEKARSLAECLRNKRSLLILDGLKPLQHPPHIQGGELADVAIKEFLRQVQRYGLGGQKNLLLISSRQPIVELLSDPVRYQELDLQTLPIPDGATLLDNLGCRGSEAELQAASQEMGGHALALVLLGRLLVDRFEGRIESREQLPALFEETKEGGHALRILRYYDEVYWQETHFFKRVYQKLLGEVPERILLQLLGLFDRPMGTLEKRVLFDKAELAKPLARLSEKALRQVEKRLEQAGLLLKCEGERREWDTHPLIRAYFGQSLREKQPKLYRQAQLVLFEYYQSVPEKHQPDTLEELEPLYRAVVHGCLAGEYQKAFNMYMERILRSNEQTYRFKKLKSYAQNLTTIYAFFPNGWENILIGLSQVNQIWLLDQASFCLLSLGRIREAMIPAQIAIKVAEKLENWSIAATISDNIVDSFLLLGKLNKAQEIAKNVFIYAERSDKHHHQIIGCTRLATLLHRQGNLKTALMYFEEAKQVQHKYEPDILRLYGVGEAYYCSFLLDQGNNIATQKKVLKKGQYAIEISKQRNWVPDIAFDYLTIARAFFAFNHFDKARPEFDKAVQRIHKSGRIDSMPEVLLARANFHRQQQNFEQAQLDLDESFDIIHRCGMKLYEVDALLLQANLNLDQNQSADYQPIQTLITETGYHLRDPELDLLMARIALFHQQRDKAHYYLQQARQRLEKMGYFGLLPAWEKVNQESEYNG
jgi:tetratricopeptide (TPR) repeat protein